MDSLQQPDALELVKLLQKASSRGTHGGWKEFLNATCPSAKLNDPARQSTQTLIAFIKSVHDVDGAQNTIAIAGTASQTAPVQSTQKLIRRYVKWCTAMAKESTERGWKARPTLKRKAEQVACEDVISSSESKNTVAALIQRTWEHPKFKDSYRLPSYRLGWSRTARLHWTQMAVPPRLLALDCEMCRTDLADNALLGVCVVDASGAVVYKELIRPAGTVLDFRTAVTGTTAADLEGVTTSLSDAKKAVKALLTPGTVLVGHALHHDLTALCLDHAPVIDTSLIFSFRSLEDCTPSLKDLAKLVLGVEMRARGEGRHDSREDACVAMQLVMHELQQAAPTPPLTPPVVRVAKDDLRKLLIHNIPKDTTLEQLIALFPPRGQPPSPHASAAVMPGAAPSPVSANSHLLPQNSIASGSTPHSSDPGSVALAATVTDTAPTLNFTAASAGSSGAVQQSATVMFEGVIGDRRLMAVFPHAGAANDAFKALQGQQHRDSAGRACKEVLLSAGRQCKVRKMACHNGLSFAPSILKAPAHASKADIRLGNTAAATAAPEPTLPHAVATDAGQAAQKGKGKANNKGRQGGPLTASKQQLKVKGQGKRKKGKGKGKDRQKPRGPSSTGQAVPAP